MKRSFFLSILIILSSFILHAQKRFQNFSFDQKGIVFRIDPRIELLNTMELLLGNPDANPANISYKKEILDAFYKYKNDTVIVMLLDALKNWRDLSSPVFFMLNFDNNLNLLPNLDSTLARKGGGLKKLQEFAKQIKLFSERIQYVEFFNAHRGFYELTLKNTQYNFRDYDEKDRIESYFGIKNRSYTIILNLLEGNGNFGTYVSSVIGNDLYAIISSSFHNGDIPSYTPSYFLYNLIYHEFSHSYVNHLVYENASKVSKYQYLFEPVKISMENQGYDNWLTVVHETIVRAVTSRLATDKFGEQIGFFNFYRFEVGRRFIYVEAVCRALKDYEENRSTYKNFTEFFPKLLSCFSTVSSDDVNRLQGLVKEYRSPDVPSIPHPNEARYDTTMIFIVSSHERTKEAQDSVLDYTKKYRALITDRIKIITDEEALKTDLTNSDIIVFGTINGNSFLKKYINFLPLKITDSSVSAGQLFKGNHFQIVASWLNPFNTKRQMNIHTAQQAFDLQNYFYSQYKDGNNYWIAENLVTLAVGDFKRGMQIWYAE